MPPTELGQVLAQARRDRGWSLRRAERETRIRNAHLFQIESGGIARPEPSILWSLAEAYELDFDVLMRITGHIGRADQSSRRSLIGAALHALDDLTPEEQQGVLRYMDELRKTRERPVP